MANFVKTETTWLTFNGCIIINASNCVPSKSEMKAMIKTGNLVTINTENVVAFDGDEEMTFVVLKTMQHFCAYLNCPVTTFRQEFFKKD